MADAEDYCHRCGGPNIVWSAPSPLWNQVMRGGSINGEWQFEEIICPTCFAFLAQEQGIVSGAWRFSAEPTVELETVTPSGRVWDSEAWLWREQIDNLQTEDDPRQGLSYGVDGSSEWRVEKTDG